MTPREPERPLWQTLVLNRRRDPCNNSQKIILACAGICWAFNPFWEHLCANEENLQEQYCEEGKEQIMGIYQEAQVASEGV